MINVAYYDKPLILIGVTLREKLVSHHGAVNEADSCLFKIYAWIEGHGSKVMDRRS